MPHRSLCEYCCDRGGIRWPARIRECPATVGMTIVSRSRFPCRPGRWPGYPATGRAYMENLTCSQRVSVFNDSSGLNPVFIRNIITGNAGQRRPGVEQEERKGREGIQLCSFRSSRPSCSNSGVGLRLRRAGESVAKVCLEKLDLFTTSFGVQVSSGTQGGCTWQCGQAFASAARTPRT